MLFIIINLTILFGVISLIFLSPAVMNIGLIRISNDYEIDMSDRIKCFIPFYNNFYGWNIYAGTYFCLHGISSIILIVSLLLRAYVMYFNYYNTTLQTVTICVFLISILFYWISNAWSIYSALSDSGVYTFGAKLFFAFTVIAGQVQVGYYMPRRMYYYNKKDRSGNLYGR